ncbi:hypothetical protein J8273_0454 [Carpediemonas membranifera]|uniref:Uncharacterized protein n=1 Tax=Carpediemonas membranifera TaxID=201153 RepID=A0A8J6B8A9_9EUKA|nr:hypothetical protein J8273_0454 [Carpediemonas membranifera]|eukprot:KAG9395234.1 hypothetical protein J8273_0454 [Carpediemonas membranifera]
MHPMFRVLSAVNNGNEAIVSDAAQREDSENSSAADSADSDRTEREESASSSEGNSTEQDDTDHARPPPGGFPGVKILIARKLTAVKECARLQGRLQGFLEVQALLAEFGLLQDPVAPTAFERTLPTRLEFAAIPVVPVEAHSRSQMTRMQNARKNAKQRILAAEISVVQVETRRLEGCIARAEARVRQALGAPVNEVLEPAPQRADAPVNAAPAFRVVPVTGETAELRETNYTRHIRNQRLQGQVEAFDAVLRGEPLAPVDPDERGIGERMRPENDVAMTAGERQVFHREFVRTLAQENRLLWQAAQGIQAGLDEKRERVRGEAAKRKRPGSGAGKRFHDDDIALSCVFVPDSAPLDVQLAKTPPAKPDERPLVPWTALFKENTALAFRSDSLQEALLVLGARLRATIPRQAAQPAEPGPAGEYRLRLVRPDTGDGALLELDLATDSEDGDGAGRG